MKPTILNFTVILRAFYPLLRIYKMNVNLRANFDQRNPQYCYLISLKNHSSTIARKKKCGNNEFVNIYRKLIDQLSSIRKKNLDYIQTAILL